ncbi:MAG: putative integral rane protein superfamily [Micrococcaceae bacterium]|nr:putative integral rane protein superfamily [Micrococcaceae bacterium]
MPRIRFLRGLLGYGLRTGSALPPWTMAVTAMLSIQLSSALSVNLIAIAGATGTAWLKLTMGAVILLAVVRPPLRSVRRRDLPTIVGLGAATGLMSVAFLAAIDRIPLGTAVAIEFLGPLSVAALRSPDRRMLAWPALALAGVVLLAEPWHGQVNIAGIGFAVLSGAGWGVYILLTQRIGETFSGVSGLAMTIPIAAVLTAAVGIPSVAGQVSGGVLGVAVGLAFLAPVLPFMLEMLALRRMTHTAFGTLMALEPAFGVLLGMLVLHQMPSPFQTVGIFLVVLAGAAAQRGGQRVHDAGQAVAPTPAGTS